MSEAGDLSQDNLALLVYVMKYCKNGFEKRPLKLKRGFSFIAK